MECFRGIIAADFAQRDWKDAEAQSVLMDKAATAMSDKFYAEASAGKALMHPSVGPVDMEQMRQAEAYIRSALLLVPANTSLLVTEGRLQATLGHEDEAKATFQHFLDVARDDNPERNLAKRYLDNPKLATVKPERPAVNDSSTNLASADSVMGGSLPKGQAASAPSPAYLSDPKFEKALAEAKQRGIAADERLARWKKANKIANGQCVECLHQVLLGQINEQAWKDAINSSNQLEALTDEKKERYFAYAERGDAYMHLNDGKPNAQQLASADTAFGLALQIAPASKQVLFAEGTVLAKQGRDEEARAIFQRYLDTASAGDHYRTRAEHFVDNPHLASQPMAPPFRLVTAQGDEIELDDMGGKVVLLDFWATWCGPCKETTPEIAHLAKEFAGQPLVVISISTDRDDIAWKAYIEKNHMDWPQYRDANGSLSSAYAVSAIPRFFTIDTDGVLQSIKVGANADVEGDIRRLLSKARKAEKRKADAAEQLSPPATPRPSQVAQNPVPR